MSKDAVTPEYSEGICGDGAAILRNGVMMRVEQIVEELTSLAEDRDQLRAELAALRSAPVAVEVPERHMDETDAWSAAGAWMESIRLSHEIDEHQSNSGIRGGGILSAWSQSRLVALAVVVRDDRNHSLLVRFDVSHPSRILKDGEREELEELRELERLYRGTAAPSREMNGSLRKLDALRSSKEGAA